MNKSMLIFIGFIAIVAVITNCNQANHPQILSNSGTPLAINKIEPISSGDTLKGFQLAGTGFVEIMNASINDMPQGYYFKNDSMAHIYLTEQIQEGKQIILLSKEGASVEDSITVIRGRDGKGIVWKGSLERAPEDPDTNWAYHNKSENIAYLWNGTSWNILIEGFKGVNGVDGADGKSITWKGTLSSHPQNPDTNWVYFNSDLKVTFLYSGDSWDTLSVSGMDGVSGSKGDDGLSMIWKGALKEAPQAPNKNWVYFNTSNNITFIFTGLTWDTLTVSGLDGNDGINGENGTNGQDGSSIIWKGELATAPENADTNWAYFNTNDKKSFIFDGSQWQTLAISGTDGKDGTDATLGFALLKPINNATIKSATLISYSLADSIVSLTIIRKKTTDNSVDTITLKGSDVAAGVHEDVVLAGNELTESDSYNFFITAVTVNNVEVSLPPVFGLTVDNTAPQLLNAQAIQKVFGCWSAGDQLIFNFSEPMENSTSGVLGTLEGIKNNLADVSGFSYHYFNSAIAGWSIDSKTLIITLSAADSTADILKAGNKDDTDIAFFNPSALVTDCAGNSDNTSAAIPLISKGDLTPPSIVITSPREDTSVCIAPVIMYQLSENLAQGKLVIKYKNGGKADKIILREWALDSQRSLAGTRTIAINQEGVELLKDSVLYSVSISGKDGAGNSAECVIQTILADNTKPSSPVANQLFVRNYANELILSKNATLGKNREYLRLYVNGNVWAKAQYPGPYGEENDECVINNLESIPDGSAIGYSLIDEAGNESEIVSDGSMPYSVSSENLGKLKLVATSHPTTKDAGFKLNCVGNLSPNHELYYHFNTDVNSLNYLGSIDGGGSVTTENTFFHLENINVGDAPYYVYREPISGHYSGFSEKDGGIEKMTGVEVIDNDGDGVVSSGDDIEVFFSGLVNNRDFSIIPMYSWGCFGTSTDTPGSYKWGDIENSCYSIAPVSKGSATSFISPKLVPIRLTGTSLLFRLTFSGYTGGAVDQIRFELNHFGIGAYVESVNGKHNVIPYSIIDDYGTSGGFLTSDF